MLPAPVSANMFDEDWPRFVVRWDRRGKTKVLSLLMAWSYFHKLYEADSTLARNFLLMRAHIIVPGIACAPTSTGCESSSTIRCYGQCYAGRTGGTISRSRYTSGRRARRPPDRQPLPDQYSPRLSRRSPDPSLEDDDLRNYFLAPFGAQPVGKTTTARSTWARLCARSKNSPCSMTRRTTSTTPAWRGFSAFRTFIIGCCKRTCGLLDPGRRDGDTAPRRRCNFVQTVSDYPLVEAIAQNVVKHPVLPDGG